MDKDIKSTLSTRQFSVSVGMYADLFNDPANEQIIKEKVASLVDAAHRSVEAQTYKEGHYDIVITLDIESAKKRPLMNPDGSVCNEGDPGVEPWKP